MTSNREEAHDYAGLVASLSDDWRVVLCRGRIQWIVQRRGAQRAGAARWTSVAYHRLRSGLIIAVHRRCGAVTDEGMAKVLALPERIDLMLVPA